MKAFSTLALWLSVASISDGMRVSVDESEGKLPLCANGIVASMCASLNRRKCETDDDDVEDQAYYLTKADCNKDIIHAVELAEHLMVNRDSVVEYFKWVGAANVEEAGAVDEYGAYAVQCQDLCEKMQGKIPAAERPPSSDVACRWTVESEHPVCDVDVSDTGDLSDVVFTDSMSNHKDVDNSVARDDVITAAEEASGEDVPDAPNTQTLISELNDLAYPVVDVGDLQFSVANLFHIFPASRVNVLDAEHDAMDAAETESGSLLEKEARQGGPFDKGHVPEWKNKVFEVSAKAVAYTAKAIQKMGKGESAKEMKKWFGNNDEKSRKEVLRVLNGVHRMLNNVDYVYPGGECTPQTYAYVYPGDPHNKNRRGQFIYYLCPHYMKVKLGEQIETLTHEGSHHMNMYTDDVCAKPASSPDEDCTKAYGRPTCEELAKSQPGLAIQNADSFCYLINDLGKNSLMDSAKGLFR